MDSFEVGQIWVDNKGLEREIVEFKPQYSHKEYPYSQNVIWKRPDKEKLTEIWMPYWINWSKKATLKKS